jgi:hypothetical protein
MTRHVVLFLLALACAAAALGDCQPNLEARSTTKITVGNITDDCGFGTPAAGDPVTITAGGTAIATTVVKFVPAKAIGTVSLPATLQLASTDPEPEKLTLINNESTVTVAVDGKSASAQVLSTSPNYFRYTWSVGPAESGDAKGESGSSSSSGSVTAADTASGGSTTTSGAMRLKLDAQYASSGMFGTPVGTARTVGTVSIDTTDQNSSDFIDNNQATLGFQWKLHPAGNVLKQIKIGFQGSASKAAHSDIHDLDGTVTFSAWLPIIHNLNLFNRQGEFISTPLAITASYGRRNREQEGDQFRGNVFTGTALYHVFAIDRYKADLNVTWTVNDLTNRPATTPRTQRLYQATISYLADPAKGFSVLTSFESGSAGVMLKDVRQYFVALALSKLNFSGSASKSP